MVPAAAQGRSLALPAAADQAAPVAALFDEIHGPPGIDDADLVVTASAGGIARSDGTAVASSGDAVPGLGRLTRFSLPQVNAVGDVVFAVRRGRARHQQERRHRLPRLDHGGSRALRREGASCKN